MKCFSILLLCLLAESSFAVDDCKPNEKVDFDALSSAYREAVKFVPVPSIEYGDNATEFEQAYVNILLDYVHKLTFIVYHRAKEIGEELVNAVQKRNFELQNCLISIRSGSQEPTCADHDLKELTKQFNEFLGLIPGNALIKRRGLPELPEQTANVTSRTKKHSPGDVFVNLAENLNIDFASILGLSASIHLAGWSAVRDQRFNILQTQIRDEILNDLVLVAYSKIANETIDSGVQSHVETDTWNSFKVVSDRIIWISNDYIASKNRECSS